MIYIKSKKDIALIRESGKIIVALFKEIRARIREGVTTRELDEWIGDFIEKRGAHSAFKGYRGYPSYSCISVNEEVVHGIPSSRKLKEGDIVSVDVGVKLDGYIADAARTFPVGKISKEKARLLEITKEALRRGISQARAGNRVGDISYAIQSWVEKNNCSVVKTLFGHGVGYFLHEDPIVPNFGKACTGERLKEGMVLAIEPMVNLGGEKVRVLSNRWTVVTSDRKPSAHFENTIAIVNGKPLILTE
ncbi:MAG TPA: type I methionyl aminopeptidase [Candidatus Aerophobetes bacterium]|uniref:Methionine aminopeptidase n=1 Tax=Aerophobetes bacterium TaxID=2030807 RepID=A0A7V5LZF6_UNCAE|nr:type I methionyl aminopeptidase [Candidatus Aerophobetes bacterium]